MCMYGKCECFVMQMYASCGSPQCCVLHSLQFVNAGRGRACQIVCPNARDNQQLSR